jgi:hypothetical protein
MSRRPGSSGPPPSTLIDPEEAAAEAQIAARQTYVVESKWCGFIGGFGSENDIARILNRRAAQGYRLTSSKTERAAWMWIVPRIKLLMFFERVR